MFGLFCEFSYNYSENQLCLMCNIVVALCIFPLYFIPIIFFPFRCSFLLLLLAMVICGVCYRRQYGTSLWFFILSCNFLIFCYDFYWRLHCLKFKIIAFYVHNTSHIIHMDVRRQLIYSALIEFSFKIANNKILNN